MLRKTLALVILLLVMGAWLPAGAAEATEPDKDTPKPKKWYDRITFSGDVRLRYEGFDKDGSFDDDRRDRFRTRLRAGFKAAVTEKLSVGLQLRNGNPDDPVSNNTTFDGGFQFKEFNLAQGYVDYQFVDMFGVVAGKFDAKKRWKVSDMQWDDDVTVEGAMENLTFPGNDGSFKGVDIAAYQYILEESKSGSDSYLLGGQMRGNFKVGDHGQLAIGAGFDSWQEPQSLVDLTASGDLGGNKVTNLVDANGMLVSDFDILNVFAEYKYSVNKRWPVKVNLFYFNNLGADGIGEDEDTAYFGRLQVGDYKELGHIALRYSYYYSEPDALFYVFTQSDTSRGSDVKAHRFDFRAGLVANSYFNFTWYNTNTADSGDETLNRWQADYIIKF